MACIACTPSKATTSHRTRRSWPRSPSDAAAFWVLKEGGALLAVVGCEIDLALQRAWLRGPLWADPRAAEVLLRTVGPTLETALPAIRQFDAFPALDSEPLNAWLRIGRLRGASGPNAAARTDRRRSHPSTSRARGGRRRPIWRAPWHCTRPCSRRPTSPRPTSCADWASPTAPSSSRSLNDDAPSGYLFVQDAPIDHEVYIDYLGVDAPQRRARARPRAARRGRALGHGDRGRDHVALTVREDRRSAHALYRQSGFIEVSSGRHWRKTVATPVTADPRERG